MAKHPRRAVLGVLPLAVGTCSPLSAKRCDLAPASVQQLGHSPAQEGSQGAWKWYLETAAHDLQYAVVAGSRESGDCLEIALAIASTRDGADNVAEGQRRVQKALAPGYRGLLPPHLAWWKRFWAQSRVQRPDPRCDGTMTRCSTSTGPPPAGVRRRFRCRSSTSSARFGRTVPFFVSEFYPGWLDHSREPHAKVDAAKSAGEMEWILAHSIQVNLYVFHGGTTFGFTKGANYSDHFQPQPTGYDFDAPRDERGRPTLKCYSYRKLMANHLPAGTKIPEVPASPPAIEIPLFDLDETASLLDVIPALVPPGRRPLSMEDVGQSYGYILFCTPIAKPGGGLLVLTESSDYAVVLLNGRKVGALDRRHKQNSAQLSVSKVAATLDILMENAGRTNYSPKLTRTSKGITKQVTLAGKELTGWEISPLALENVAAIWFSAKSRPVSGPVLRLATFHLNAVCDTFLDIRGWGKGCVSVNDHNPRWFRRITPQQTLYLPGVWLKKAIRIVALDSSNRSHRSVRELHNRVPAQLMPELAGEQPARTDIPL